MVKVKVLEVDLPRKRIALTMRMGDQPQADQHAFDLIENDTWTLKYAPGTLRAKRVQKLAEMADPLDG